ncbi:MAG TPA: DJ-1/PfpI family protein [Dermatophilaceae bacterium]|nr:DJ-1/PfpI family protein [Dermatophilaceae bacterium]
MAKLVMVVAPERFRDEELFQTRAELEAAGHATVVASTKVGLATGSRGGSVECDSTIEQIDPAVFDGVVFVGGGGSKLLFTDAAAQHLAQAMHRQDKLVAAICLAPVILANAGVLAGKRATVAGTQAKAITAGGATYTGPGVTTDGNVVTANGPKSARLFGQKINEVLASQHPAAHPGGRPPEPTPPPGAKTST